MSTWAAEDLERCALMVPHRWAVHLPNALEHCLHGGGYRCRTPAPRTWIAVRVTNLALPTRQPPRQLLHVVGTVEDCLERAALLNADALGLGEPLQPASERELGTELCTPVHVDCHACEETLSHHAPSLRSLIIRKLSRGAFDIHRHVHRSRDAASAGRVGCACKPSVRDRGAWLCVSCCLALCKLLLQAYELGQ